MKYRQRNYTILPDEAESPGKKNVYIAGKVSGRDYEEARAEFDNRAEELERRGYTAINPMDHVAPGTEWRSAMRVCIALLAMAHYIDLLPGWGHSEGAKLEYSLACKLGIKKFSDATRI